MFLYFDFICASYRRVTHAPHEGKSYNRQDRDTFLGADTMATEYKDDIYKAGVGHESMNEHLAGAYATQKKNSNEYIIQTYICTYICRHQGTI